MGEGLGGEGPKNKYYQANKQIFLHITNHPAAKQENNLYSAYAYGSGLDQRLLRSAEIFFE